MEKCISAAKKLIDAQIMKHSVSYGVSFEKYHKTYYWTNENINGYLNLTDFTGKTNALSVLASGDQAFNLVSHGISEIDTFDINALTEYFALGIKRAMILKYSYKEFLDYISILYSPTISLENLTAILLDLLPYMEEKHKIFWNEIINYNYKLQKAFNLNINLMQMLYVNGDNLEKHICDNTYLLNEGNYNLLRSRLSAANISFKCANAMCLGYEFDKKYDFILLSNIMDYFDHYWGDGWDCSNLKVYERQLERLSKEDALIFLNYLFDYSVSYKPDDYIFDGSKITVDDLNDEEVICLPDNLYTKHDGMILKRVTK